MKNLRLSIHSDEHLWLREILLKKRIELGLTQQEVADRLSVIRTFVSKVELGDRRLDLFEFLAYCKGLEIDPKKLIDEIEQKFLCSK